MIPPEKLFSNLLYKKKTWKCFSYGLRSCLQPIGNVAERFHALCLKDSGVLYEDPYVQVMPLAKLLITYSITSCNIIQKLLNQVCNELICLLSQIGIKAEWRSHQGRLVLFLGNKNTAALVSVQALMLAPSHLKLELSEVPQTIPPRAQVSLLVML